MDVVLGNAAVSVPGVDLHRGDMPRLWRIDELRVAGRVPSMHDVRRRNREPQLLACTGKKNMVV